MNFKKVLTLFIVISITAINTSLINFVVNARGYDDIPINSTNFPDANFREHVLNHIDWDNDNLLNWIEIEMTENFNLKNIQNSKGLEYFDNLENINLSNSLLSTLDLSKNLKINDLYIRNCQNLKNIDLSKNLEINDLYIRNCQNLKNIDLSKNLEINDLYICNCENLKNIDLSKNLKLENLNITNCPNLKNIDLTKNSELKKINIGLSNLKNINLNKNTKLNYLNVNIPNLKNIDLSKNTKLEYLDINLFNLKNIDLSKNLELKDLDINGCQCLKYIDLSKNTKLKNLISDDATEKIDMRNNAIFEKWHHFNNASNLSKFIISKNNNVFDYNFYGKPTPLSICPNNNYMINFKDLSILTGEEISKNSEFSFGTIMNNFLKINAENAGDILEIKTTIQDKVVVDRVEIIDILTDAILGDNNIPVLIDATGIQFNVTVPTSLPVNVDNKNIVTTASNLKIQNNSAGPIKLSNVSLSSTDWTIKNYGEDNTLEFNKDKVNNKNMAMRFGRIVDVNIIKFPFVNGQGLKEQQIFINNNIIKSKNTYDIDYKVKISPQATPIVAGNLGRIIFTFNWDK